MISYFLGSNSPGGFHSLYETLLTPERQVIILKGGPGCGKSTLMRLVAKAAEEKCQPVEYIYCSGDPDSLDAILLPAQNAAIVDGTAPHVIEPTLPGAAHRYLDLGECYDREGLQPVKSELRQLFSQYKACYPRAYHCLSAADEIAFDCRSLLLTSSLSEKLDRRARGIAARHFRRESGGSGQVSQRFLTAATCQGLVARWETVSALCGQVYELEDSYGLGSALLSSLLTAATAAGHDGVACMDPMAPDKIAHLLLPGLGLGFVTSAPELPYPGKVHRRIRVDAAVDQELLRRVRPRLRFARKVASALTQEAIASLAQAKALHDELEALYNPHVDFALVEKKARAVAADLGF